MAFTPLMSSVAIERWPEPEPEMKAVIVEPLTVEWFEPERVPVLVARDALDVDLGAEGRRGAVLPDPGRVEAHAPAGAARLGEGQHAARAADELGGDVVADAADAARLALEVGVEVRAARAEAAGLGRVAVAVAVELAAPLDHGLPDRHHGPLVAGELRVGDLVVVGRGVGEVVEDAHVALGGAEAAAEQREASERGAGRAAARRRRVRGPGG
jgi:hypothetical protein